MTVPDTVVKLLLIWEYEDIRHLSPVFIGDTICAKTTILDKRASKTKLDRGIIYVETIGYNQHGEPVISFRRNVLVKKIA